MVTTAAMTACTETEEKLLTNKELFWGGGGYGFIWWISRLGIKLFRLELL